MPATAADIQRANAMLEKISAQNDEREQRIQELRAAIQRQKLAEGPPAVSEAPGIQELAGREAPAVSTAVAPPEPQQPSMLAEAAGGVGKTLFQGQEPIEIPPDPGVPTPQPPQQPFAVSSTDVVTPPLGAEPAIRPQLDIPPQQLQQERLRETQKALAGLGPQFAGGVTEAAPASTAVAEQPPLGPEAGRPTIGLAGEEQGVGSATADIVGGLLTGRGIPEAQADIVTRSVLEPTRAAIANGVLGFMDTATGIVTDPFGLTGYRPFSPEDRESISAMVGGLAGLALPAGAIHKALRPIISKVGPKIIQKVLSGLPAQIVQGAVEGGMVGTVYGWLSQGANLTPEQAVEEALIWSAFGAGARGAIGAVQARGAKKAAVGAPEAVSRETPPVEAGKVPERAGIKPVGESATSPVGKGQRAIRPTETPQSISKDRTAPKEPWEDAIEPRSAATDREADYFYHTTTKEALGDIKEDRLNVGKPENSEVWTDDPQMAWPDGATEPRSYWSDAEAKTIPFSKPGAAVVRVKGSDIPGGMKRESTGDFFSREEISPESLEYLAEGNIWKPLLAKEQPPGVAAAGVSPALEGRPTKPPAPVTAKAPAIEAKKSSLPSPAEVLAGQKPRAAKPKQPWEMTEVELSGAKGFLIERLRGEDISQAMPDGRIKLDPDKFFGHDKATRKSIIEHERAHFVEDLIKTEDKVRYFDVPSVMDYRGRNINEKLANLIQDGAVPREVVADYPFLSSRSGRGVKPVVAEAPKPTLPTPTKPPVKKLVAVEPAPEKRGKVVSLRKAEGAAIRKRLNLDKLAKPQRESFQDAWDEAASTGAADNAITVARGAVDSKRTLTPTEHAASVQKYVELNESLKESRKAMSKAAKEDNAGAVEFQMARTMEVLDDIDVLTRATDAVGSEAGRALSVRRLRADTETLELGTTLQAARSLRGPKGKALSPSDIAWYEKRIERNAKLEKELAIERDRAVGLAAERDKAVAEKVAAIERKQAKIGRRTTRLKDKLTSEREALEKELAGMGNRMSSVVGPPPDALYALGKLTVNYIKEGVTSLEDAIARVRKRFPDVTDRDVWEALNARSPKAQARAKTIAERDVREYKTQSRLQLEIDNLENETVNILKESTRHSRRNASERVRELQKRVRDLRKSLYGTTTLPADRMETAINTMNRLQDQLENQYRLLRQPKPEVPPDLAEVRKDISLLRRQMRAEDILADINEQTRTGVFKVPERRVLPTTPSLERMQIEIRRGRQNIRARLETEKPWTTRRAVIETINTLRTSLATADLSGTLRQGLIATVTDPIGAAKDFGKALKATFRKYSDEQIDNSMRNAPTHDQRMRAGLELTERDAFLNAREEMFMSNVFDRWRIFKWTGVRDVVGASERHMRTYLNLRRANLFDRFLEATPNATDAEMKAVADWINVMTGRGELPGRLKAISQELGAVVFAPRFAASRIQTPGMILKYWNEPRVRKLIAKDLAKTAAFGALVLETAHLAGLGVGTDPRNSDWGKIRVGDTHFDIWGGFQQPMRLLFRFAYGVTDLSGISGKHLKPNEKEIDPWELLLRFASYKMGPGVTLPRALYTGKTAVGEEKPRAQIALDAITPLVVQDFVDAFRKQGFKRAALVGVLAGLGVGAATFEDSETSTRIRIRKLETDANDLLRKGKKEESKEKRKAAAILKGNWNRKNPKNKIVKP